MSFLHLNDFQLHRLQHYYEMMQQQHLKNNYVLIIMCYLNQNTRSKQVML